MESRFLLLSRGETPTEYPMTGQAVLRALLIITLIVTANVVRPFSVRNVTSHLFNTARSLKIVLPDSAQSGFSTANVLASTLTRSWFEEDLAEPVWYGSSDVLAYQTKTNAQPEAQSVEKGSAQPDAPPVKMSKAIIDRAMTARRIARKSIEDEDDLSEDLALDLNALADAGAVETLSQPGEDEATLSPTSIAFSNTGKPVDEIAALDVRPAFLLRAKSESYKRVSLPVSLPAIDGLLECALSKVRPVVGTVPVYWVSPRIAPQRKTPSCDEQNAKQLRLIALIEEKRAKRVDAVLSSLLECEDETTEVESKVETNVMTATEEAAFEIQISQPAFPLQLLQDETGSCNPLQ